MILFYLISGDHVILLVENTRFIVNPANLTKYSDTMLGRMFGMRVTQSLNKDAIELVRPNDKNEYMVADGLTSACFRVVLVNSNLFLN
jgi:BTB/POZ domain-containing protein 10